jgi:hypothetical protein
MVVNPLQLKVQSDLSLCHLLFEHEKNTGFVLFDQVVDCVPGNRNTGTLKEIPRILTVLVG